MARPATIVERAFELARSGDCRDVVEIRRRLKREGFAGVDEVLAGSALRKQLRALCEGRITGSE